jgi:hypothetical protein
VDVITFNLDVLTKHLRFTDSYHFFGIFNREVTRNYKQLQEITRNYKKLQEITRNYKKLQEITRNYKKLQEITRNY